jgi:hypothetical protein
VTALKLLLEHASAKKGINAVRPGVGTPLHAAIVIPTGSREAAVALLIKAGADVCIPAGLYGTPLNTACALGSFHIAENLLDAMPKEALSTVSGKYGTPMQSVVMGHMERDAGQGGRSIQETMNLLALLESKGVSTYATGGEFHTMLHAAAYGWAGLACRLVDKYPRLATMPDLSGCLPLHIAMARKEWHHHAAPLFRATYHALYGSADMYSYEAWRLWEVTDFQGRSGLHMAATAIDVAALTTALRDVSETCRRLIDMPDKDGWTPLLWPVAVLTERTSSVLLSTVRMFEPAPTMAGRHARLLCSTGTATFSGSSRSWDMESRLRPGAFRRVSWQQRLCGPPRPRPWLGGMRNACVMFASW